MRLFVLGIQVALIFFLLTGCGYPASPKALKSDDRTLSLTTPSDAQQGNESKVVYEISTFSPQMIQVNPTSNIQINPNGMITIGPSNVVPHVYEGAKKWGFFETKPIQSPQEFRDALIKLDQVVTGPKDAVMIEVATSEDGSNWSGYSMLGKDAHEISFLHPETFIKYRFTLLSYSERPPVIKKIGIQLRNHQ